MTDDAAHTGPAARPRGSRRSLLDRLPASLIRWIGRQQFRPYLGPPIRACSRRLRNRPRTISRGPARGLRINPSGAHPGYALGTSEPTIQELLARQIEPCTVVWDIGANVGFFTLIASRLVGEGGQVVAFEPLPANYDAIRENLLLNGITNVQVEAIALGDEVGRATLSVYGANTLAKLDGPEQAEPSPGRARLQKLEVPVSTIDAQLERFPAPALVKMDIEGGEAAALQGAKRLLTEVRPTLVCELHGTADPVMELLESCGYRAITVGAPDVPPREAEWYVHILASPT